MLNDGVTLAIAVCALIGALVAARASSRATKASEESNEIKWLQEARKETETTRLENDKLRDDIVAQRLEINQAKRDIAELKDATEEVTRWIVRVVTWAKDDGLPDGELRRLINGGPPSMRGKI